VDLINKKNIAFLEIGQQASQVTGFFNDRPELILRLAPSSVAIMWERVVFPKPGGPCSRT
jgi:hypothetical protein